MAVSAAVAVATGGVAVATVGVAVATVGVAVSVAVATHGSCNSVSNSGKGRATVSATQQCQ
jgi:hypothetical protein